MLPDFKRQIYVVLLPDQEEAIDFQIQFVACR